MKKYKTVNIYPKILETKTRFTKEEKEYLTRKGFRWYIWYSFRHPITNKFIQQKPIHGSLNRDYPDFDDRLAEIKIMRETQLQGLKNGFNPYERIEKKEYTLISALEFALSKKKDLVAYKTMESYKIAVKRFKEWLEANGYEFLPLEKVDKRILNLFFTHIASSPKTSARSSNNYKNSLSSLFTELMKYDYLDRNIVLQIEDIPTKTKRDPTWSDKHVEETDAYLAIHDPILLMYMHLVDFMFWRPKENCRLYVKDVNLDQRLMVTKTKTKGTKTKLIPEIIFDELSDYIEGANPDHLLFTPTGPGEWDRQIDGRRAVFTKRFAKVKKLLGLPKDYTIYGRRHTKISKLFNGLLKEHPYEMALSMCAEYTGHTSKAMLGYLHKIDARMPADFSHLLR